LGKGNYKKIEKISIEEILRYEKELYIEDSNRIAAVNELGSFIRDIGSKSAFKFEGFIIMIRNLNCPVISDNLANYIKTNSNRKLKNTLKDIIVETFGCSGYSDFKMHKNWKRVHRGCFSWFYYYDVRDYINVYTISDNDLPIYINHEFSAEDNEVYLKRLRGTYGS
jgi:hypothetical protein